MYATCKFSWLGELGMFVMIVRKRLHDGAIVLMEDTMINAWWSKKVSW